MGYLAKYPNRPLTYRKSPEGIQGPLKINGTADASHADNIPDRRSSFGYITHLNDGPVAWKSRLTPMVATSVAEAEYVALSECLKELLHLEMLVTELGYKVAGPLMLYTDSEGAKAIVEYTRITGRSKHIDIRYHFIQERVAAKEVQVVHIPGRTNFADLFTKNIGPNLLSTLPEQMTK